MMCAIGVMGLQHAGILVYRAVGEEHTVPQLVFRGKT